MKGFVFFTCSFDTHDFFFGDMCSESVAESKTRRQCVHVFCMHVKVCMWGGGWRERERARERVRVCVCVWEGCLFTPALAHA